MDHRYCAALAVGLIIVIIGVLAWFAAGQREGFASPRAHEVYGQATALFARPEGVATYSEFKSQVAGADPVQYTELRSMWKNGRLTPETVQSAL